MTTVMQSSVQAHWESY